MRAAIEAVSREQGLATDQEGIARSGKARGIVEREQADLSHDVLTTDDVIAFFRWLPIRHAYLVRLHAIASQLPQLVPVREREWADAIVESAQAMLDEFLDGIRRFAVRDKKGKLPPRTLPWTLWERAWARKPKRHEVAATLQAGEESGRPWGMVPWSADLKDAVIGLAVSATAEHLRETTAAPELLGAEHPLCGILYVAASVWDEQPCEDLDAWSARVRTAIDHPETQRRRTQGRKGRRGSVDDAATWVLHRLTGISTSSAEDAVSRYRKGPAACRPKSSRPE